MGTGIHVGPHFENLDMVTFLFQFRVHIHIFHT